MAQVN